jgi:membrane dipeptidase
MEELNIILDVTHLCDRSFNEAMETFGGHLWASHSNNREFVPHNRQFTNDQMKLIIERGGVIGTSFDTWMLVPNWVRGESDPLTSGAGLNKVIDNIERVCEIAGSSHHAALGTDLDGAFGKEQSPYDVDTITDLQKIPDLLSERKFSDEDIQSIMGMNWIRFLKRIWG